MGANRKTLSRHAWATAGLGLAVLTAIGGCGFVSMQARGTWVDESSGVELLFTQEGLISGTDGCNTIKGSWEEHGADVTINYTIDQAGDCSPDQVWLIDPTSAIVDGSTMQIFAGNGDHLGDLTER